MSNAIVTTQQMELTPMRVSYGPPGSEVDLGGTLSNVVITAKYTKANLMADQSGTTVRDRRTSGIEVQVTTELNEVQNKDIWKVVYPHADKIGTGTSTLAAVEFKQSVGAGDLAVSQQLILHPLSKTDGDKSTDYTFFKATASEESSLTYGPTEQAKLKIVWNILPDESTLPNKFFRYGDPGIIQIPATFAPAVPGGTNVGNGTVTPIAVNNAYTKTEIITMVCVTPILNGGVFSASGSVSGPLGIANVGIGFTSTEIDFTINDGTTDFALGDSFTIQTTAAA